MNELAKQRLIQIMDEFLSEQHESLRTEEFAALLTNRNRAAKLFGLTPRTRASFA